MNTVNTNAKVTQAVSPATFPIPNSSTPTNTSPLQFFTNSQFGNLRTLVIDNEPWFVGKDVASALGYNDTFGALKKHVETEDKLVCQIDSADQKRSITAINESGLYSLILSSKLPTAKQFKHWVTAEVLPAIRKTGGYIAGEKDMTDEELICKVWFVGKDVAEALGYQNGSRDINRHIDEDDALKRGVEMTTPEGIQQMTVINESRLYALVFGSKLETAKQ